MNQIKKEINVSDKTLEDFKKLVRKAVFLSHDEEHVFNSIPKSTWLNIFKVNFDGNYEYAKRCLMYKYSEIDQIDRANLNREKNKIANLNKATDFIINFINNQKPILFVTDFDNDGSLAQAVINEYLKIDQNAATNMHVEYAQSVNGNPNRGLTVDHIDLITQSKNIGIDEEFLIVTADNGINSREEQLKIQDKYPNAKIIITDHHNPEDDMVVLENENTTIFNPHYNPTDFFKEFNISGATTIGVLLKNVLAERFSDEELEEIYFKSMEKIETLFKVANLLDYVHSHPADKPEKDYIVDKFLELQPLMNINNSISKIITGEIPAQAIQSLQKKIPQLNTELLYDEAKNIHTQNLIAKTLLTIYKNKDEYKKMPEYLSTQGSGEFVETDIFSKDFLRIFLNELNNPSNYSESSNINPNYIEQLRPLIFGLGADYDKDAFDGAIETKMIEVFQSIKNSEKRMAEELRKGEVVTKVRSKNSVIAYADPNILTVFNRKFLNKVYNDENPGFSLTLDSVGNEKVSGSFRSLYDISDILKDKKKLEKKLNIKIETPGHERAAGFIVKSLDPKKQPIEDSTIQEINNFINDSIQAIKAKELSEKKDYLLTDFSTIKIVDKINKAVRGNVSNFEKISPIIKINENTVWTDSYTTEQFTMPDLISSKKYGYVTINTDFNGGTIILPVELIRKVVESGYKDYISLSYLNGGASMAEKVVSADDVSNIIDIRIDNAKTVELEKAFELDFKTSNKVELTREQIYDNPFFKYHDYGKLNFELFENMVIGIIDQYEIDMLTVFDVEANGFANSKIINIGTTNYAVNENSGKTISKDEFERAFFQTSRKENFLLNDDQISDLIEISVDEFEMIPIEQKKTVLQQKDSEYGVRYFTPKNIAELSKKKSLPWENVKNYKEINGKIIYNREIKATMLAYLIKDDDFLVPQEMTNLTGITQETLEKYGRKTEAVDAELAAFYEGKKVLFGAHNTPYDGRVSRANMPKFYNTLLNNQIYDSAIFAKNNLLAYDLINVCHIENVDVADGILFYDSEISDFNLKDFIRKNENGYFPDRSGKYLLEIDNSEYYIINKEKHEKFKIDLKQDQLLQSITEKVSFKNNVKFSVEKLSEQWMIHALLLNDESFNISHVDLNNEKYTELKPYEKELIYFQDNYHFDKSFSKNLSDFNVRYLGNRIQKVDKESGEIDTFSEAMALFGVDFLEKNKTIAQKFVDAWMYKSVLGIKDPTRIEVTNDLVDLVNYHTNIPKDKIREIFDAAINFKDKYGIDHVLMHEMHANGPWRGDVKGDISFEDKLTLGLLAQREYNSYSHDIKAPLKMFTEAQILAQMSFDKNNLLRDIPPHDSYSYRQAIQFDRKTTTKLIDNIQSAESELLSKDKKVVCFKLDTNVLPAGGHVYCVKKKGVSLTREEVESHKEMLSFIMLNSQIWSSAHNEKNEKTRELLLDLFNYNKGKIIDMKNDLSKSYDFIEYNRKIDQIDKQLSKTISVLTGEDIPKRGIPKPTSKKEQELILDNADSNLLKKYAGVHNKIVSTIKSFWEVDSEWESYFDKKLLERINDSQINPAKIEIAMIDPVHIKTGENVFEDNFLKTVAIARKDPTDWILNNFHDYRIINEMVNENHRIALTYNRTSKRKP